MFHLPPALKAKGEQAEAAFRASLNQSGVAFLYVEQSAECAGQDARQNQAAGYLVGTPYAGSMAFDVNAKSVYDDCLLFEVGEVDKLARYSAHFHVSVYFACLDLDRPDRFHWVALRDLIGRVPERSGKARVLAIPTDEAFEVDFTLPFLDAVQRTFACRLGTISCDLGGTCRAAGVQDMGAVWPTSVQATQAIE